MAESRSLANHAASRPVDYRLYLPKGWADDKARREKEKAPEEIAFEQIVAAYEACLPRGTMSIDAGYDVNPDLRSEITALDLAYVAGIK